MESDANAVALLAVTEPPRLDQLVKFKLVVY